MNPIHENPIFLREYCRFARHWWGWALFVLLGWVPAAWFLRGGMADTIISNILISSPLRDPLALLIQDFVAGVFTFSIRADVFVGFFLIYRSFTATQWSSLREEIAVTLLTPRQILQGKAALPIATLLILNAMASPAGYWDFIVNPDYIFSRWGITFSAGGLVASFALLEDFLFVTTIILITMDEFLFAKNTFTAALRSFAKVVGLGCILTLAAFLPDLIYPARFYRLLLISPPLNFLTNHFCFFVVVIPAEWMIIQWAGGRLQRRLDHWLHSEIG